MLLYTALSLMRPRTFSDTAACSTQPSLFDPWLTVNRRSLNRAHIRFAVGDRFLIGIPTETGAHNTILDPDYLFTKEPRNH